MAYRGLDEELVDKEQQQAAKAALKLLTRDLGINVDLRFFSGLPPRGTAGRKPLGVYESNYEGERGIIWIKVDQSPAMTVLVTAHEAQHAQQARRGDDGVWTRLRCEADAEGFAHDFMAAYGLVADCCSGDGGRLCPPRAWYMVLGPTKPEDVARWARKVLYGHVLLRPGEAW
jgi:hypothetical protein